MPEYVRENISSVQQRIAEACRRSARGKESVRLVAVSKTVFPERIREAYEAGLRDFGENRVQEALSKRVALADVDITWHMIGHLQTNKAKTACETFRWVHSVDSMRVAEKLDRGMRELPGDEPSSEPREPIRLKVLIEVNLGGEEAKSGVAEDEALELASDVGRLENLELRGLMLVPPYFEDAERSRPLFSRLRELAKMINSAGLPGVAMNELSMGMSHDFEVAVEEGATIVRVGTEIFGVRS